jgi:hypothetical protein
MTPEAQRIAIAEACGWKFEQGTPPTYGGMNLPRGWRSPKSGAVRVAHPDYLNDLNAMHEAEKVLGDRESSWFAMRLWEIVGGDENSDVPYWEMFKLSHATAAQHAEAFLRTIGKWKD